MASIHYINNKLKRQFEDIQYLMKKQEKLLEEMNKAITEKDDYVINLETNVRKQLSMVFQKMKFLKLQESLLKDMRKLLLKENIITSHIYT